MSDRADVKAREEMLSDTYLQTDVWGKTYDKAGWIETGMFDLLETYYRESAIPPFR
jgi:hypothetical protein